MAYRPANNTKLNVCHIFEQKWRFIPLVSDALHVVSLTTWKQGPLNYEQPVSGILSGISLG